MTWCWMSDVCFSLIFIFINESSRFLVQINCNQIFRCSNYEHINHRVVNSEWSEWWRLLLPLFCLWQLSHASSQKKNKQRKEFVTNSKHTAFYDTLNENVHKLNSTHNFVFVLMFHVSVLSLCFFSCISSSCHRVKAHLFLALIQSIFGERNS